LVDVALKLVVVPLMMVAVSAELSSTRSMLVASLTSAPMPPRPTYHAP
jgi:hypothetical protein